MLDYFKKYFISDKEEQSNSTEISTDPNINETIIDENFMENEIVAVPPKLRPEGLSGLVGEIATDLSEGTEAKKEFVASNFFLRVASSIPRNYLTMPYGPIDTEIRIFAIQVLQSGAGKGIAEKQTNTLFKEAIELLGGDVISPYSGLSLYSRVFSGGLSTGEGIAYELRDSTTNSKGETQQGIDDKRLLVIEPEFFNVLSKSNTPGSILSSTIRKLFDGDPLEPMTKKDRVSCMEPHVCILGQITRKEFVDKLDSVSISNGFANRFPIFSGVQPVHQPIPNVIEKEQLQKHAKKLNEIMAWCHESPKIIKMSDCYKKLWYDRYSDLKQLGASDSIEQSLMTRASHYAAMYAMLFAVQDMTTVATAKHLTAALAWIDYWHESVRYIFCTEAAAYKADQKNLQAFEVLTKIKELVASNNGQPIARTPLQQALGKKYTSKQLSELLRFLQELPKAPIAITKHQHNKQVISLT